MPELFIRKIKPMPVVLHGGTVDIYFKTKAVARYHMIGGIKGDWRYAFATQYKFDHDIFETIWFTGVRWLSAQVVEVEIDTNHIECIKASAYDAGHPVQYDQGDLDEYIRIELANPTSRSPPSRRVLPFSDNQQHRKTC